MLTLLFRLVAALPLSVVHAVGGALGRLICILSPTYRRRLTENLAQAGYTGKSIVRQAAAEAGRQGLETPWVWMRPPGLVLARTSVANEADFDRLMADGRPVMLLAPHLGCFEVIAKYYGSGRPEAAARPLTAVYRIPRKAILRNIVETGRASANVRLAPAEMRGVRMLMRAMKAREVVGILPDQVPTQGDGVWAPFFGRWAYTMTLPARLALQYDALTVFAWAERLPRGQGWRLHFEPLDARLSGDQTSDVALLNHRLEQVIRRHPAQYLWGYNRYKVPADAPPPPSAPAR